MIRFNARTKRGENNRIEAGGRTRTRLAPTAASRSILLAVTLTSRSVMPATETEQPDLSPALASGMRGLGDTSGSRIGTVGALVRSLVSSEVCLATRAMCHVLARRPPVNRRPFIERLHRHHCCHSFFGSFDDPLTCCAHVLVPFCWGEGVRPGSGADCGSRTHLDGLEGRYLASKKPAFVAAMPYGVGDASTSSATGAVAPRGT